MPEPVMTGASGVKRLLFTVMGKGSTRRPASISEAEQQRNWDRLDWGNAPAAPASPPAAGIGLTPIGIASIGIASIGIAPIGITAAGEPLGQLGIEGER